MNKGWVVVRFLDDGSEQAKTVEWFEEQFEAQEESEKLNEQAPAGVWYGWERQT
jgi:hypothetical protein